MRDGDDIDAELDLRHRAFGPMTAEDREYWRAEVLAGVADSRQFGVWAGDRLVGAARFYDLRQWWHGRALPSAAIAGVKVAPEARGRGVGRALITALLGAMTERGYPLSVLYPTTMPLYRSVGWELAGGLYRAEIPGRSLSSLLSAGAASQRAEVRRAGTGDAEQVVAVLGAVHASARDCGPCTFDPATVRRWLAEPDFFCYLAQDGFLGYGWDGNDHEIMVHLLQAASARTVRTFWEIVASHATVADVVRANVGPADPVGWLTREPDVSVRQYKPWMLRVLDPPAAIAAAASARPSTSACRCCLPTGTCRPTPGRIPCPCAAAGVSSCQG
ncbi:MAG TPA: GNAT family N-acetyltransferase [Streptosporangiaceae bacterium]|nr:GNAT family N-acetyltransferase [Streptosporangiaceae bacterium]